MSILKLVLSLILAACLLAPCHAEETAAPPTTTTKPKAAKTTATKASATKAATSKTAATKPAVKKRPLRTEAELSGYASETADSYYGRISLVHTSPKQNWWIKTAYRDTTSRSYGKTRVTENNISGYDLDTYYRANNKNAYRFASFVAGNRKRTPASSAYYDSSDFRMLSVGYGRPILPGVELETAIAHIAREKNGTDDRVTPLYTIRVQKPVSTALALTADVHLVQPFSDNTLVDSRMNLTYKFTPSLSMRLTYVANNVLGTTLTKHEWDKLFRVSLVFSH